MTAAVADAIRSLVAFHNPALLPDLDALLREVQDTRPLKVEPPPRRRL